ncbi:MAG: hypothetical protein Q8M80_13020 [Hydrogenophaga sp.]|uniref:hypothetical protein n=1 Tax=Hydrogenophaga sp. TaxID=1904254 RepID=UPI0027347C38|nr:hypothetical protein [Hydrogenophaga sp.]MDP3204982.1 hypothetical protein [Hydrogenophaga sp.]MDP3625707.1 hypothetical protein [Hydrogenophaga sp.]MDZ4281858.1 hypothetical protein [Hydrogenophaga sp.]
MPSPSPKLGSADVFAGSETTWALDNEIGNSAEAATTSPQAHGTGRRTEGEVFNNAGKGVKRIAV